jgi:hypothetical protein
MGEIRTSHILAASFYRLMRESGARNPNPLHLQESGSVQISRQVQERLLCSECENRLNNRGERYVASVCMQSRESFPLQEALAVAEPMAELSGEDLVTFNGMTVGGVSPDQLAFFAASVFWRASARPWRVSRTEAVKLSLGPYEDQLRRYLLDEAPFPKHAALVIGVASARSLELTMNLPLLIGRAPAYRDYWFCVPGIGFTLIVGRGLGVAQRSLCIMNAPHRPLFVSRHLDGIRHSVMLDLIARGKVSPCDKTRRPT